MNLALLILVAAAFLPIYLGIRATYRRLPLHIDTGFYVSNSTIASGRFLYRHGWNSHYAGCSKWLPELFYSLIYLWNARTPHHSDEHPYIRSSRMAVSLYNYFTCIGVAFLALTLGADARWFIAALIVHALLSSEPHHGAYQECAEVFEALFQVVGTLCLLFGVEQNSPLWIMAGAALWSFDVFFIKLSSVVAAGVLLAGASLWFPASATAAILGALVPAAAYVGWVRLNGQSILGLIPSLRGHEASFRRRPHRAGETTFRFIEKARCALDVFRRQPIPPMLALAGILFEPAHLLVRLWMLGAVATYVVQSTNCRYYLIPLQAPLALFATAAVVRLLDSGVAAIVLLAAAGLAWFYLNPLRAARLDRVQLNEWVWRGFRPRTEYARNLALERTCRLFRPIVADNSVLIYGPFNQAYVLLDTSWPTPIVAPEHYLDHVHPPWQRELNRKLLDSPPEYVLDTSSSFDALSARVGLGLDYRLVAVVDAGFRLFRLGAVASPRLDVDNVRTFRPQSASELEAEELRVSGVIARHEVSADLELDDGSRANDPVAGIRAALSSIRADGHRRVALYGAGRFTIRHAEIFRNADPPVCVVLDDDPARWKGSFLDWPVRSPEDTAESEFDAILVASDRYESMMARRARRLFGRRVPVYTVSGHGGAHQRSRRNSGGDALNGGDVDPAIRESAADSREAALPTPPLFQESGARSAGAGREAPDAQ